MTPLAAFCRRDAGAPGKPQGKNACAPVLDPESYGREKKSILQKTGLMFSIIYGRKNAGFSIFSHDLCVIGHPAGDPGFDTSI
jgi:hypothetical protein